MQYITQTEIKMDCVSKDIRGATPGLLIVYSESTVYRVYHLTMYQSHLITLCIPEMEISLFNVRWS